MAHFAELDKDNKVLRVIVISNDDTHDEDGVEREEIGIAFCKSLFGADTKWVQTSYNNSMRHHYAGVGDIYDAKNDVFVYQPRGEMFVKTPEEIAAKDAELEAAKAATPTE